MSDPGTEISAGLRVAILSGGASSEREVSLVSGRAVAEAVESLRLPVDVFEIEENCLPQSLDRDVHLVLPLIHGSYGEDGCLSADLDAGGFTYGGSQEASSALCYDKIRTKKAARELEIPVARDRPISPSENIAYKEIRDAVGEPFILKPRRDGSSVGLHLVDDDDSFEAAMEDLRKVDYLAESYHTGYDLTVGVLDGEPLEVIGIHPEGNLYDYEHKYTSGLSQYDVPAKIDPALRKQLQDWSGQLFSRCGCRDIARVDFHMGADNLVRFLEVNTIPGMTSMSLLPKSAACCGLSFAGLTSRWIQLVMARKFGEDHK